MQAWGRRFSKQLKPGDVVALVGDLGAGKTTLVQGIAAGWGYRRRANSPTFALVNEYATRRGPIHHMDLYRLTDDELRDFPLDDYFEPGALTLIEWADRMRRRWPAEILEVQLNIAGPHIRQLALRACSARWRKRLAGVGA
jgi:tRNA threonylcarbamoyladenosine biosynthesis protein TsaE